VLGAMIVSTILDLIVSVVSGPPSRCASVRRFIIYNRTKRGRST
jgi:hypothetical protein